MKPRRVVKPESNSVWHIYHRLDGCGRISSLDFYDEENIAEVDIEQDRDRILDRLGSGTLCDQCDWQG